MYVATTSDEANAADGAFFSSLLGIHRLPALKLCAVGCKQRFDNDPEKYAQRTDPFTAEASAFIPPQLQLSP